MEFVELTEKEFDKVANNFPNSTYLQTTAWAKIKSVNNWQAHYVGVKENDKLVAATLILARPVLLGKSIFYAPRGPLMDYSNTKLINFFIDNIKKYVQKHNGFLFKIDPLVEYRHHDSNGNLLEDGFSNQELHETLIKKGFMHKGFRVGYVDDLQYRWSYAINMENKTYDEVFASFSSKGRGHIRKAMRYPFVLKDVDEKNIMDFKHITEHTAKRHNHFDRTLAYYQSLIDNFAPLKRIKMVVLYLDKEKYLAEFKDDRLYEIIKEEKESMIPLSCAMFIMDKNTVNYVYSGSYSKYNYFNAQYMIQNEMIKWAIDNNYTIYDFGGISGDFDPESSDYGVYAFKKNFNGRVIEYIGEYDLRINKFYYFLYTKGYKIYRNSKKIFAKLKK